MSARDEAVEVVARALYETDLWFTGVLGVNRRPVTWAEMVEEEPEHVGSLHNQAEATLEVLDAAGFLATEQEWAVEFTNGILDEFADNEDRARAEAKVFGRGGQAHVVSRRVTPWRSA